MKSPFPKAILALAVGLVATAASAQTVKVAGDHYFNAAQIQQILTASRATTVSSAIKAIENAYFASGYPRVKVIYDSNSAELQVHEGSQVPVHVVGDQGFSVALASGQTFTASELKKLALVHYDSVSPTLTRDRNGNPVVLIRAQPAHVPLGSVTLDTLGPRYSGSAVANLHLQKMLHLPSRAVDVWADASKGASIKSQSANGSYLNYDLGASSYFMWNPLGKNVSVGQITADQTLYKEGGTSAGLGIRGDIRVVSGKYTMPLNVPGVQAFGKISYLRSTTSFDTFHWRDSRTYLVGKVGASKAKNVNPYFTYRISGWLERGQFGSQSISGYPLSGSYEPVFNGIGVNAKGIYDTHTNWLPGVDVDFNYQQVSAGAPSYAKPYIGGPGRGAAVEAFGSGTKAFWGGLKFRLPQFRTDGVTIAPYVGLQAATDIGKFSGMEHASAAVFGADMNLTQNITLAADYATGRATGTGSNNRVDFTFQAGF